MMINSLGIRLCFRGKILGIIDFFIWVIVEVLYMGEYDSRTMRKKIEHRSQRKTFKVMSVERMPVYLTEEMAGVARSNTGIAGVLILCYCCDKALTITTGEERVYLSLQLTVCHRGKSSQELKQEPWRLLLLAGSFSGSYLTGFLIQLRVTCPGDSVTHIGWSLLHQLKSKQFPRDMLTG